MRATRPAEDETGTDHYEDAPCSTMHRRGERTVLAIGLLAVSLLAAACVGGSGAKVFFDEPREGDLVTSPFTVEMAVEGFVVEPAANGIAEGRGHLHIMVDTPCVEPRLTVPPDQQHLHFGDGRTSAVLDLPPGEHFLCLQAADGNHRALDATDEMTITVVPE